MKERLKDLRTERSLTLEQLMTQTKLSKSLLGNYESTDFKEISSYVLIKLAKFYNETTDYLLKLTKRKRDLEINTVYSHSTDEVIEIFNVSSIKNYNLYAYLKTFTLMPTGVINNFMYSTIYNK